MDTCGQSLCLKRRDRCCQSGDGLCDERMHMLDGLFHGVLLGLQMLSQHHALQEWVGLLPLQCVWLVHLQEGAIVKRVSYKRRRRRSHHKPCGEWLSCSWAWPRRCHADG